MASQRSENQSRAGSITVGDLVQFPHSDDQQPPAGAAPAVPGVWRAPEHWPAPTGQPLPAVPPQGHSGLLPAVRTPTPSRVPNRTPKRPTGGSGAVWRAVWVQAAGARGWVALKWSREAARRKELRSELRPIAKSARRAYRTARSYDPQGRSQQTRRARTAARRARRAVPDPLWWLTAKVGGGLAAAGYVAGPRVPVADWIYTAAGLGALAIMALTWVIVRTRRNGPQLAPTAEERAILSKLHPHYWTRHAERRGLEGTMTGRILLTGAGIVASVRLDGQWTVAKLASAEEQIRNLIGCRTSLRIEIRKGERGGWAQLALRTRSAADGDDLRWSDQATSFGVDTITGALVHIPLGERILIAGMSGAGKSVASRPLLFHASEGDVNTLVIFDFKKVEGRLWDHRARVASTAVDAVALADELVTEMAWRLDTLPKGRAMWTPSLAHPRITVVVDEGAEAVAQASNVLVTVGHTKGGKPITERRDAVEALESIARMGRAACIDLVWMTQKPTTSGSDPGVPTQIAAQLGLRIGLAVTSPGESRVIFGEDAGSKGWNAEDLPMPGVALVRHGKSKPHPIAVRFMSDRQVIGLPDRPIWHGPTDSTTVEQITDEPDGPEPIDPPPPADVIELDHHRARRAIEAAPDSPEAKILKALIAAGGPLRQSDIAITSGVAKGTVSKIIRRLIESSMIERDDAGALSITATGNEKTA